MDKSLRLATSRSAKAVFRSDLCPRCVPIQTLPMLRQRRNFNTSRRAEAQGIPQIGNVNSQNLQAAIGKSKHTQQAEMKKNQLPTDLGLFPDIIIPGPWSTYWPLLREDRKIFLKFAWMRFKALFTTTFKVWSALRFQRGKLYNRGTSAVTPLQPLPLHLTSRVHEALDLYHGMHAAMARGDTVWFQKCACHGLRTQAVKRIERRKRSNSPPESWRLIRPDPRRFDPESGKDLWVPRWPFYTLIPSAFRPYSVVGDLVGQIPMGQDCISRQVYVRVKTTQELDKGKGEVERKEVEEVVVIQQTIWAGKEEPWRIWGTIKNTSADEVVRILQRKKAEGTWGERLRAMLPTGFNNVWGG